MCTVDFGDKFMPNDNLTEVFTFILRNSWVLTVATDPGIRKANFQQWGKCIFKVQKEITTTANTDFLCSCLYYSFATTLDIIIIIIHFTEKTYPSSIYSITIIFLNIWHQFFG